MYSGLDTVGFNPTSSISSSGGRRESQHGGNANPHPHSSQSSSRYLDTVGASLEASSPLTLSMAMRRYNAKRTSARIDEPGSGGAWITSSTNHAHTTSRRLMEVDFSNGRRSSLTATQAEARSRRGTTTFGSSSSQADADTSQPTTYRRTSNTSSTQNFQTSRKSSSSADSSVSSLPLGEGSGALGGASRTGSSAGRVKVDLARLKNEERRLVGMVSREVRSDEKVSDVLRGAASGFASGAGTKRKSSREQDDSVFSGADFGLSDGENGGAFPRGGASKKGTSRGRHRLSWSDEQAGTLLVGDDDAAPCSGTAKTAEGRGREGRASASEVIVKQHEHYVTRDIVVNQEDVVDEDEIEAVAKNNEGDHDGVAPLLLRKNRSVSPRQHADNDNTKKSPFFDFDEDDEAARDEQLAHRSSGPSPLSPNHSVSHAESDGVLWKTSTSTNSKSQLKRGNTWTLRSQFTRPRFNTADLIAVARKAAQLSSFNRGGSSDAVDGVGGRSGHDQHNGSTSPAQLSWDMKSRFGGRMMGLPMAGGKSNKKHPTEDQRSYNFAKHTFEGFSVRSDKGDFVESLHEFEIDLDSTAAEKSRNSICSKAGGASFESSTIGFRRSLFSCFNFFRRFRALPTTLTSKDIEVHVRDALLYVHTVFTIVWVFFLLGFSGFLYEEDLSLKRCGDASIQVSARPHTSGDFSIGRMADIGLLFPGSDFLIEFVFFLLACPCRFYVSIVDTRFNKEWNSRKTVARQTWRAPGFYLDLTSFFLGGLLPYLLVPLFFMDKPANGLSENRNPFRRAFGIRCGEENVHAYSCVVDHWLWKLALGMRFLRCYRLFTYDSSTLASNVQLLLNEANFARSGSGGGQGTSCNPPNGGARSNGAASSSSDAGSKSPTSISGGNGGASSPAIPKSISGASSCREGQHRSEDVYYERHQQPTLLSSKSPELVQFAEEEGLCPDSSPGECAVIDVHFLKARTNGDPADTKSESAHRPREGSPALARGDNASGERNNSRRRSASASGRSNSPLGRTRSANTPVERNRGSSDEKHGSIKGYQKRTAFGHTKSERPASDEAATRTHAKRTNSGTFGEMHFDRQRAPVLKFEITKMQSSNMRGSAGASAGHSAMTTNNGRGAQSSPGPFKRVRSSVAKAMSGMLLSLQSGGLIAADRDPWDEDEQYDDIAESGSSVGKKRSTSANGGRTKSSAAPSRGNSNGSSGGGNGSNRKGRHNEKKLSSGSEASATGMELVNMDLVPEEDDESQNDGHGAGPRQVKSTRETGKRTRSENSKPNAVVEQTATSIFQHLRSKIFANDHNYAKPARSSTTNVDHRKATTDYSGSMPAAAKQISASPAYPSELAFTTREQTRLSAAYGSVRHSTSKRIIQNVDVAHKAVNWHWRNLVYVSRIVRDSMRILFLRTVGALAENTIGAFGTLVLWFFLIAHIMGCVFFMVSENSLPGSLDNMPMAHQYRQSLLLTRAFSQFHSYRAVADNADSALVEDHSSAGSVSPPPLAVSDGRDLYVDALATQCETSVSFLSYVYMWSVNRAIIILTSMEPQGRPYSVGEQWYLALACPFSVIFMNLVLARCLALFRTMTLLESTTRESAALVASAMAKLNLPPSLQFRINRYQRFLSVERNSTARDALFRDLSPNLDLELRLILYKQLIETAPFFQELRTSAVGAVVSGFDEIVVCPGDIIIRKGAVGREMFFILKGRVEVCGSADGYPLYATKSQGEYFGEAALLMDTLRSAWVRAKTFVVLAHLTKDKFNFIMEECPDEKFKMLQEIDTQRIALETTSTSPADDHTHSPAEDSGHR